MWVVTVGLEWEGKLEGSKRLLVGKVSKRLWVGKCELPWMRGKRAQTCYAPVGEHRRVSLLVNVPTLPPEPSSKVGALELLCVSSGIVTRQNNSGEKEMASQQCDLPGP